MSKLISNSNVKKIFQPAKNTSNVSEWKLCKKSIPFESHRDEYEYAMIPDWDPEDEGAVAVTETVLELAGNLFDEYANYSYFRRITPKRDGSLSFIWDDERGNYVYLDIGPGQTVHLYHDVIKGGKWEGVSIASDSEIRDHLKAAFKFLDQKEKRYNEITFVKSPSSLLCHILSKA
jgi:hypothetical protein